MTVVASIPALAASGPEDPGYREPPANVEVEMALLGAILVNNSMYERVSDFLEPEHFIDPAHQKVFAAVRTMSEKGSPANPATLRPTFERDPAFSELGGAQYLVDLAANAYDFIDAETYGRIIHDLYIRRELINVGSDTVVEAYRTDLETTAESQIEAAEQRLFELATTGETRSGFRPFDRTLTAALEMAAAAYQREGRLTGITTGFERMDKLLGGFQKSDLIILAGRPGMGKTALATNMAFNAATSRMDTSDTDKRHVVGFFSLEMSAEQLALRIIGEQSGVPSDRIRRGAIDDDALDTIVASARNLEQLALFIDDTPAITVNALRTRARRLHRTEGRLDLIVVDYLQLMRAPAGMRIDNRVQEISEITRGLKAIAKELNVPVLALSQLSRAVEQREDKRPQLADLRESGSIEQDADVVMFVYREEYYSARKEPPEGTAEHEAWQAEMDRVHDLAEVIIAKQRHGPTDKVRLYFRGEFTRFENFVDIDPGDVPL